MISSAFYYDKTDFLNLRCNLCSYKASVKPFISHFAVSIKSQKHQQQSFLILDKCNLDGHGLKGRAALTPEKEEDYVDFWWQDRNKRWTPSCTACCQWCKCNISLYNKQIYLLAKASGGGQSSTEPTGTCRAPGTGLAPQQHGHHVPPTAII